MIVKMIFDINKVDTDRGGSTIRLKITRLVEVKIRKAGKNLISLQKKNKKTKHSRKYVFYCIFDNVIVSN